MRGAEEWSAGAGERSRARVKGTGTASPLLPRRRHCCSAFFLSMDSSSFFGYETDTQSSSTAYLRTQHGEEAVEALDPLLPTYPSWEEERRARRHFES